MNIRQQSLIWLVFALCVALSAGHAAGIDGEDADEPGVESAAGEWSSLGWHSLPLAAVRYVADLGIGPDGLLYAVVRFKGDTFYLHERIGVVTGIEESEIIQWNGKRWLTVGPQDMPEAPGYGSYAAAAYDAGTGPFIYVMSEDDQLFRVDESGWHRLGERLQPYLDPWLLMPVRFDGRNVLVAANQDIDDAVRLLAWDGHAWAPVSETVPNGRIQALLPVGDAVLVGGAFDAVGGEAMSHIVKFNGRTWLPVGAGLPFPVTELAASADGRTVYAAAKLGYDVYQLFAWDGQAWHAVPGGVVGGHVNALAVLDGRLYVGGHYYSVAGELTGSLAVWDGSKWTTLGLSHDSRVTILRAHAGGLYVAGLLHEADGRYMGKLMRWTPQPNGK